MASFDKTIPPGGEGKIVLKVHTKGYQGKIHKSALVNTNDPKANAIHLGIAADVKPLVYVSRRYVYLQGVEGHTLRAKVEIKAGLDRPLSLEVTRFDLDGKVAYSLEELEKGKRFEVLFTSVPSVSGNYRGLLTLRTNYPEKPVISIRIVGRIRKVKETGAGRGHAS